MRKILIVEDDEYINDLYCWAFKHADYDVIPSLDGRDALEKLSKDQFEMILLDIMLPNVTGIDVLKEIRKENSQHKNTPVFLISNLGQDEIIKECFKLGADGYLVKAQLTPRQVVEEINSYLAKKFPVT